MADAFVYAANLQDANLNPAPFALASSAGSTQSAAIDFGTDAYKLGIELDLSVPALNTTMVPDTRTVTYIIETSTVSNFASIDQTLLSQISTGAGGAGVGAFQERVRLPSNCAQYVRAKITTGASTGDCSTISATLTPRFRN